MPKILVGPFPLTNNGMLIQEKYWKQNPLSRMKDIPVVNQFSREKKTRFTPILDKFTIFCEKC